MFLCYNDNITLRINRSFRTFLLFPVNIVFEEEGLEFVILLFLSDSGSLQGFILLHRLLHSILEEHLTLHLVALLYLLFRVRLFLLIELSVQLQGLHLEPVNPLAQVCDAIIVH